MHDRPRKYTVKQRRDSLSHTSRIEQRSAYLLVTPALLVVLVVAVYPLGSGLLKSFTDETFASDRTPAFLGLRNYVSLLGVTVRIAKPLADPSTGMALTDSRTGAPLYPRSTMSCLDGRSAIRLWASSLSWEPTWWSAHATRHSSWPS